VLATAVSAFIGWLIVRRGCAETKGSPWSILWFFVACVISMVVSRLVLAAAEQTTIPDANNILRTLTGKQRM
jgi:uncharacterized membrane protein